MKNKYYLYAQKNGLRHLDLLIENTQIDNPELQTMCDARAERVTDLYLKRKKDRERKLHTLRFGARLLLRKRILVARSRAQTLFDPEQPIVFRSALAATH